MRPELIETMLVTSGRRIPLLHRHLTRLRTSAQALQYPCEPEAIEADVRAAASMALAPGPHRLRLLLNSAGDRTVQASPLPELGSAQAVMLSSDPLDPAEPLLRHKTTHRPWYEASTAWLARHPDVFDVLYLNTRGELCEGTRSNVYLKLGGQWFTPAAGSGCLPGVQRAELLDQGTVQERTLTAAMLRQAEAIRVSNALRGWFDVTLLDTVTQPETAST
ncbi:aminotransferase class IV family protein [Bordetella genomosp. 13]|uniref:aminotransferase class IV family protein n=1 Tax=Bordetella genomosp. 13 TaxID=463040 RepID=UPI0011A7FB6E|nr:aminotransferase class IV family protein [Bordetella genomosp. 13]